MTPIEKPDDSMDGGGTTPRMEEVEPRLEQRPRAASGTAADEAWREQLTPEQYAICRCSATERAFSGKYWDHHEAGRYLCVACRAPLFDSAAKFDSGSGWPSYWQPIAAGAVSEQVDESHGMRRIEVRCAHCDSHLGHVFPDGPPPTGLRYCINSAALDFLPK